jgi:hypothetical protein
LWLNVGKLSLASMFIYIQPESINLKSNRCIQYVSPHAQRYIYMYVYISLEAMGYVEVVDAITLDASRHRNPHTVWMVDNYL